MLFKATKKFGGGYLQSASSLESGKVYLGIGKAPSIEKQQFWSTLSVQFPCFQL